jgi:hypothetical protein
MAKKVKEVTEPVFRDQLQLKHNDIIGQEGMQESVLLSDSDITICGGNRGGGKSYVILLEPLYDCGNPNFAAMVFRKEVDQLERGLYADAAKLYPILGAKMTKLKAVFPSGATITYDHIQNEAVREVEKRFKGLSIPAFYFDELDMFSMDTFKRVIESNRNSNGIRNRVIATCNPNPDSWLRTFLDWWIDEDGYIDMSRDRVTRYFYLYGTSASDIIWGSSRGEVVEKAKHYLDKAWRVEFAEAGLTKEDLVKSIKFIKGDLAENKILLKSQPTYLANISSGGSSAIARNLDGNWNVKSDGDEMVTRAQMDWMFDEHRPALRSGVKRMSIDVALLGIDTFIIVCWDGMHIEDVIQKKQITSSQALGIATDLMREFGVREDKLIYDYNGNGQVLNDLRKAYGVRPQSPPIGLENAYDNLKSQILFKFGTMLQEGLITCSPIAAGRMFEYGKGVKKEKLTFKEILQNERRALMIAESSGKTRMLGKKDMKKILGGVSPDFLEGVAYGVVPELDKRKQSKGFQGLCWL